jgi:hypothetical protein
MLTSATETLHFSGVSLYRDLEKYANNIQLCNYTPTWSIGGKQYETIILHNPYIPLREETFFYTPSPGNEYLPLLNGVTDQM